MQFVERINKNQYCSSSKHPVCEFHRREEEQTKTCAASLLLILFFLLLSFSREVTVGDYNKSHRALHLPPAFLPSSLRLSLKTSTPGRQRAGHPLGFGLSSCREMSARRTTHKRKTKGRKRRRRVKGGSCGTTQSSGGDSTEKKELRE